MKVFLGIDGGGTKTTFALMNQEGDIVSTTTLGTIHFKQIGISGTKERIAEGIEEVLAKVNLSKSDLISCFAAIPGYGEFPELIEEMQVYFKEIFSEIPFMLGNDCVAGYAGSLKAEEGVNLVLGTGAIAYGQNEEGEEARSSGWGPFCGDEGSAHDLGQACIRLFAKEADGRLPCKILYNLLKEHLNLKADFDLIDLVHKEWNLDRTKIASLSRILGQAAISGDPYALELIENAAYEGFLAVKAVATSLNLPADNVKVSYSGGVFGLGETILEPFSRMCSEVGYSVQAPLLTPLAGSLVMAIKHSSLDSSVKKEIIAKLKNI